MSKDSIQKTSTRINRRTFLGGTLSTVALFTSACSHGPRITVVPRETLGGKGYTAPSDKLNIAGIGVGGQGGGDMRQMSGEHIVALCDADWQRAGETFERFPDARKYRDYREMLEAEADNIDAVVIATPDHHHAPASMRALKLGKHVFVEKPMAHTIEEARLMTQLAKKKNLVTQMGNGGHAGDGLRETYEYIHAGAIGEVREVHVWSDRPKGWWPQGVDRPTDTPPVPENLAWDLWLGPAPERPYNPAYVPFKWRGWFDFGTGALGDMAVHNADPAFFCLGLDAPYAVEAESSGVKAETYPELQHITYYFKTKERGEIKMVWYDGGIMPPRPREMEKGKELDGNGIMFFGDEGKILCGGWAGAPTLLTGSRNVPKPEQMLPRSIGHYKEWIEACKRGDPKGALAGFEYSGPYIEALLVGNLAVRLGKRIEWDSKRMRAKNAPEANRIIRKDYRKGWEV